MRILVEAPCGLRNAHPVQPFAGLGHGVACTETKMQAQGLGNLFANSHMGRQGSEGILKDHGDLGAANLIELDRGQTQDLLALEPDRPARLAIGG